MTTLNDSFEAIAQGRHKDPFKVLGPHAAQKNWVVRSWQPQAQRVELLDAEDPVSYKHLTLPTTRQRCRYRWSPYN